MPLRPHFRDARGRLLPLTPGVSIWRPNRGGLSFGHRYKLESAVVIPPDVKRRVLLTILIALLPLVLVQATAVPLLQELLRGVTALKGYRSLLVILPAAVLLGMFMPLVCARIFRGGAAESIATAYAAAGHCGSCCYPLPGVKPAADGCTVCPECGAAFALAAAPPSAEPT